MAGRRGQWVRSPLLLYLVVSAVMTYPFSLHLASGVLSIGTDTDLYIWAVGWDVHAFLHHPFSIFDANIFFPFTHTLAYSENVIGSAMLAAPIVWLTNNPMLAMNIVAWLSVPLGAYGAYLLARRIGVSEIGARLAGLVFGFSPPRFLRLDQFHLTTIEWIPFSLAFLHGYFETGSARDLRLAVAFFSLQAITSGHGAAFLALAITLLLAERVVRRTPLALRRRIRDLGLSGALLLVPAALIYIPYREAQVEVGLRRALDDWTISTSSFFTSASHVQTWIVAHSPDWTWLKTPPDAWLFPGFLPIALGVAAFVWRRPSSATAIEIPASPRADFRWLYLVMALVCVWFAIGPPIGIWQWVYWLPGLNFVRVPSRFMLLGVLALGVLAGLGFDRLVARARPRRRFVAGLVVGTLMAGEFAVVPLDVQPYRVDPPAVDRWFASLPGHVAAVEVPLPDSLSVITQERRNTLYMLYSLGHYRPIVEGYSGIQPPGYMAVHWQVVSFPDETSLRTLLRMGVTHAIEHIDLIPPTERDEVAARYERMRDWLTLVHVDGDGRVYELHSPRK